jgi:hypothetical protein
MRPRASRPEDDIDREFRRIGAAPEGGLAFSLPYGTTLGDLAARLREVPDGAGWAAIEGVFATLPRREPPWAHWPPAADYFTPDDYRRAAALVHDDPERLAADLAPPRQPLGPSALALLWHGSPELAARVATFRVEARQTVLAVGLSPDDADAADTEFERHRGQWADVIQHRREEALRLAGPAIQFRLRPEVGREDAHAFFRALGERGFPTRTTALFDQEPGGRRGTLNLRYGVSVAERIRIEAWLGRHPAVQDVSTGPEAPAWWPHADPDGDTDEDGTEADGDQTDGDEDGYRRPGDAEV